MISGHIGQHSVNVHPFVILNYNVDELMSYLSTVKTPLHIMV